MSSHTQYLDHCLY